MSEVRAIKPEPSNEIRVRIETPEGTEEATLDLNLDNLTMRESVRLEKLLGDELFGRLVSQKMTEMEMARPSLIQALLFVKIKTFRPDLEIDDFDVDFDELVDIFGGEPVGKHKGPSSA